MIDNGQLLERFRALSREMQNGIQTLQKQVSGLDSLKNTRDLETLQKTLKDMSDAWSDYSGWILISTLEDLKDARQNCAPGRLDIQSKFTREKNRKHSVLATKGVKLDTSGTTSIIIETYIQYFEQLLDLLISNAIKYSPKAGTVIITTERRSDLVIVHISSVGPLVAKHEQSRLGEKEFRAETARNMDVSGQGYGLYNVVRISELLEIDVQFIPSQKILFNSSGISFADFTVKLTIPDAPKTAG
jgi:signal transduction histidine kinase